MEEQENKSTEANNDLPQQTLAELMDAEFGTPGHPGANTLEQEQTQTEQTDAQTPSQNESHTQDKETEQASKTASEAAQVESDAQTQDKSKEALDPPTEPVSGDVEFDEQTKQKVAEMQNDSHPGIKFAELRRELKDARLENERIVLEGSNTEEFQTLKLKAEQVDSLQTQVDDLQSSLALNDYKSTPEFDSLVNKPLSEIKVLAKNIEESNGITEGIIMAAIQSTDQKVQTEAIERITEEGGLNVRDQNRIYTAADRFLQITATDSALKVDASSRMQALDDMQVSQRTALDAQNAATLKAGIEGAFSRYEGRIPGFVTEDGLPTEGYNTLKAEAASVQLTNVQDASFAIMAATLLPDILKTNESLMGQLADKNKALAKFGNSGVPSGTPTEAAPAKGNANKPQTFMEALAEFDAG